VGCRLQRGYRPMLYRCTSYDDLGNRNCGWAAKGSRELSVEGMFIPWLPSEVSLLTSVQRKCDVKLNVLPHRAHAQIELTPTRYLAYPKPASPQMPVRGMGFHVILDCRPSCFMRMEGHYHSFGVRPTISCRSTKWSRGLAELRGKEGGLPGQCVSQGGGEV